MIYPEYICEFEPKTGMVATGRVVMKYPVVELWL